MSGKLVGEVFDAAVHLQETLGVSRNGFLALLVIAERSYEDSRQGSVPLSRFMAALGRSDRTARDALRELVDAKLIEVVERGFTNRHVSRAPVYRLADVLGVAEALATASDLGQEEALATASRLGVAEATSTASGSRCGSFGSSSGNAPPSDQPRSASNGVLTELNGGQRTQSVQPPYPAPIAADEEPPEFCRKHPNGTDENCAPCGAARRRHGEWLAAEPERKRAAGERRRAAIAECGVCDEYGQIESVDDDGTEFVGPCPHHREIA